MQRDHLALHRFVIFGAGRSGLAAARLLYRQGLECVVADEKASCAARQVIDQLDAINVRSFWGDRAASSLQGNDVMVLSPGIPQTNPVVEEAQRRGMAILSEIEFASLFVSPKAKIIAITGTNGKTTTTTWIAHLLKESGFNAILAGNVGDAWCNHVDSPQNKDEKTIFVVETSSFQLEAIDSFHPNIAILTNLAPDHLDRYDSYNSYIGAKKRILRNMTPDDAFISNADNPDSAGFAEGAPVRQLQFSLQPLPDGESGAFVRDNRMVLRTINSEVDLLAVKQLPRKTLPGAHNVENALAASLAAYLAGASADGIRKGLTSFPGVEHRIEFCGEVDGILFYNDSKATNVDSLEKALKSFESPVVLIAGGRDKHSDYTAVNNLVQSRVKKLISIGEAAPLVEDAWGGLVKFERAESMLDAVRKGVAAASPGEVVLLSPACASFDWYQNFEMRGRDFKDRVQQVIAERKNA